MPDLDLDAIRRELEARRASTRERVATLAERPELGAAQGFGKRIGDGTTEAISRLTDIGVGRSLEEALTAPSVPSPSSTPAPTGPATAAARRSRPLACGRCPTACCASSARRRSPGTRPRADGDDGSAKARRSGHRDHLIGDQAGRRTRWCSDGRHPRRAACRSRTRCPPARGRRRSRDRRSP